MIAMNRVLAPTDYSELALHALRYARDLAKTYRAELHVLHVVPREDSVAILADIGPGLGASAAVPSDSTDETLGRETENLRSYVRAETPDQPLEPVIAVRTGVAWDEITRYAGDANIDLIVIGTHARGPVKRILLGSVGTAVLEHAHCPVLMVPIAAMERVGSASQETAGRSA